MRHLLIESSLIMQIVQQPNLPQQEDEICGELMKLQFKLKEQVVTFPLQW
jgi:hypothetical protein